MIVKWKKIAGFRLYEISDCGEVRRISDGKTSNPYKDFDGYPVVKIKNDAGKYVRERIHPLVYKTFRRKLKNVDGGIVHIDRDVSNNKIGNLRFKKYYRKSGSTAVEETIAPIKVEVQLDDDFDDVVFLGNGDVSIVASYANFETQNSFEISLINFINVLVFLTKSHPVDNRFLLKKNQLNTDIKKVLKLAKKGWKVYNYSDADQLLFEKLIRSINLDYLVKK